MGLIWKIHKLWFLPNSAKPHRMVNLGTIIVTLQQLMCSQLPYDDCFASTDCFDRTHRFKAVSIAEAVVQLGQ